MQSMLALTLVLALCQGQGATGAPAQPQNRPPLVYLRVVTQPADLNGRLESVLKKEFEKYPQVELTEEGYKAAAVLWVYATRTSDSQKNPEGVSVAIIHARPGLIFYLLANQEKMCSPEQVNQPVKSALTKLEASLAVETPPLSHINVAHLDQLDDNSLKTLASKIVADFVDRTSPPKR